ncbi:hypothetical protein Leryth_026469 [Lithospermum erythrorhizon]|nr:hypothetical protein Leryth_026469 [Lithospermum erythrorhizon]
MLHNQSFAEWFKAYVAKTLDESFSLSLKKTISWSRCLSRAMHFFNPSRASLVLATRRQQLDEQVITDEQWVRQGGEPTVVDDIVMKRKELDMDNHTGKPKFVA